MQVVEAEERNRRELTYVFWHDLVLDPNLTTIGKVVSFIVLIMINTLNGVTASTQEPFNAEFFVREPNVFERILYLDRHTNLI
jgi:hypothetical protein